MKRCFVSFGVACTVAMALAPAASAFSVNTTSDASGSGSSCSLREAILAVHNNSTAGDCSRTSGDNTITLPAGTYTLTDGTELLFQSGPAATVNGADPSDPSQTIIDAAGTPAIPRRVIEVQSSAGATLKNVEIKGGQTADGVNGVSPGQSGTFGGDGGGIKNLGNLTLDHALVTDNFTGSGGSGQNSAGDGHISGNGAPSGSGGAIYNGSGASLSINASTIDGNGTGGGGNGGNGGMGAQGVGHFATGDDGGAGAYSGSGGGIYNLGNATITTSTISDNFTGIGGAGGSGGHGAGELAGPSPSGAGNGGDGGRGGNGSWGVDPNLGANFQYLTRAGGGGIASLGNLTMTASTISGNNTGAGGLGGTAGIPGQNLDNSFRTSGLAGDGGSAGIGGGLLVDGDSTHGQATLTNVTIAGNFTGVGGKGGAGYSGATGLGGGRGGYGGFGGGIWSIGANNLGPVTLTHATIAQNGLGNGGATGDFSGTSPRPGIRGQGAGVATGGRFNPSGSSVYFKNTLVANNGVTGTDVNCLHYYDPPTYIDFGDLGDDISYPDSSCPGASGDPMLGILKDNGGPTFTMLPATGSSAINGVPSPCPINVDQRGLPRPGPSKASCDIGAVETGLSNPTQLSVSKVGTGAGTVTSSPAGINCGGSCSAFYEMGQAVTLTATPTGGSGFTGWSGGGCSGTGTCLVTLNSATAVTATFADTAAPDTTITGGPANGSTTSDSTPTFTFSSTEPASTFECSVDGVAYAACSSPGPGSTGADTTSALSDGSHTFSVRARDAANNVDSTPDSRTFTVATSPPPGDGGGGGGASPPSGPTGQRAAALKKCKKKKKGKARTNCIKRAKRLPV